MCHRARTLAADASGRMRMMMMMMMSNWTRERRNRSREHLRRGRRASAAPEMAARLANTLALASARLIADDDQLMTSHKSPAVSVLSCAALRRLGSAFNGATTTFRRRSRAALPLGPALERARLLLRLISIERRARLACSLAGQSAPTARSPYGHCARRGATLAAAAECPYQIEAGCSAMG